MSTYVEKLFAKAVALNSTAIGVKNCETVITAGPLRLANTDAKGLISLAMTALAGQSAKEIVKNVVPNPAANFTVTMTAANRYVGLILRVSGALNTIKQAPVILVVTGTGMTSTTIAIYPNRNFAEALLLLTSDNGGVGSIAAPTNIVVTWNVASHPEAAALEYAVSAESISLRDFTART